MYHGWLKIANRPGLPARFGEYKRVGEILPRTLPRGAEVMKKSNFLLFPLLALAVGWLSASLSRAGREAVYPLLNQPPLTPPDWGACSFSARGPIWRR